MRNHNVAILKVLMAENLKNTIENYETDVNKPEVMSDEMKDIVKLQKHIEDSMKLEDLKDDFATEQFKRMNKKDMVEDIFRNNPINGKHLYTDSLAY